MVVTVPSVAAFGFEISMPQPFAFSVAKAVRKERREEKKSNPQEQSKGLQFPGHMSSRVDMNTTSVEA